MSWTAINSVSVIEGWRVESANAALVFTVDVDGEDLDALGTTPDWGNQAHAKAMYDAVKARLKFLELDAVALELDATYPADGKNSTDVASFSALQAVFLNDDFTKGVVVGTPTADGGVKTVDNLRAAKGYETCFQAFCEHAAINASGAPWGFSYCDELKADNTLGVLKKPSSSRLAASGDYLIQNTVDELLKCIKAAGSWKIPFEIGKAVWSSEAGDCMTGAGDSRISGGKKHTGDPIQHDSVQAAIDSAYLDLDGVGGLLDASPASLTGPREYNDITVSLVVDSATQNPMLETVTVDLDDEAVPSYLVYAYKRRAKYTPKEGGLMSLWVKARVPSGGVFAAYGSGLVQDKWSRVGSSVVASKDTEAYSDYLGSPNLPDKPVTNKANPSFSLKAGIDLSGTNKLKVSCGCGAEPPEEDDNYFVSGKAVIFNKDEEAVITQGKDVHWVWKKADGTVLQQGDWLYNLEGCMEPGPNGGSASMVVRPYLKVLQNTDEAATLELAPSTATVQCVGSLKLEWKYPSESPATWTEHENTCPGEGKSNYWELEVEATIGGAGVTSACDFAWEGAFEEAPTNGTAGTTYEAKTGRAFVGVPGLEAGDLVEGTVMFRTKQNVSVSASYTLNGVTVNSDTLDMELVVEFESELVAGIKPIFEQISRDEDGCEYVSPSTPWWGLLLPPSARTPPCKRFVPPPPGSDEPEGMLTQDGVDATLTYFADGEEMLEASSREICCSFGDPHHNKEAYDGYVEFTVHIALDVAGVEAEVGQQFEVVCELSGGDGTTTGTTTEGTTTPDPSG